MADNTDTQYLFLFLSIPQSLLVGNPMKPSETAGDFLERCAILSCVSRELIVFIAGAKTMVLFAMFRGCDADILPGHRRDYLSDGRLSPGERRELIKDQRKLNRLIQRSKYDRDWRYRR
jgi:hypothetical protein